MSSFTNLFRNLNLSKKSQLGPIFRTGGSMIPKKQHLLLIGNHHLVHHMVMDMVKSSGLEI